MSQPHRFRILMLLENSSFPEDSRVLLQARSLTKAGYRVTVIAPTEDGATKKSEVIESIQVYRYPAPPEWGGVLGYIVEYGYSIVMQFVLTCYVWLRRGFDTIHMHTPPDMNAIIPVCFRLFGKKFVYDLHDLSPELFLAQREGRRSGLISWVLLRFERFASRGSNLSISTNESQRDIQVARCGVARDKFHVVRNGPNEAFLNGPIKPRPEMLDDGMVTLGYVGVMGPQDGVDYLIRAVDILVNQRDRTNVRAVLVGSGAALAELKRQVESMGLTKHVQFTGRVPFVEVPSYIAGFDICCTPDPSNAYNDSCTTIKTMEYMALAKPIVSFATTENWKTALDAALYAENNNVEQYADKIERLLDDPQLRSRMGQTGRKRILEELSWEHQSRRLIQAYDGLHGVSRESLSSHGGVALDRGASHDHSSKGTIQNGATQELEVGVGFPGAIGEVLRRHLQRDFESAQLTWKFRTYYQIRPYLPHFLRRCLQRSRNQLLTNESWRRPEAFLGDLRVAMRSLQATTSSPKNLASDSLVDPSALEVIHPWPDQSRFAICLSHDIDTAEGFKRVPEISAIEEQYGIRSAWFVVPHAYPVDHGILEELRANGHEIGIHGYNHDGRLFTSRALFESRSKLINQAGQKYQAAGFRAPMVHRNLAWMQSLEFDYDASCFDIDPFQAMPGGVGGVWPFMAGRLVELPYTLPQDHTLMVTLGVSAYDVWVQKLQLIERLAGLAMLITHPDYLDTPKRQDEYRRFCEHVANLPDKWLTLPREVAAWWRQREASTIHLGGHISGPAAERGRVVSIASLFQGINE
jgi:glycosyltransferase involved in cell wall biosynthesis/peptidoglycan/xylan/chitin deacetylase (PgdA/CDA1 family)